MNDYQTRDYNKWSKNHKKRRDRRAFRRQLGDMFELFGMIASVTIATSVMVYIGYLICLQAIK